jgi:hypothetical protein
MRSEQARGWKGGKSVARKGVQRIGIHHHRLSGGFNESEDLGVMLHAEAWADGDGIACGLGEVVGLPKHDLGRQSVCHTIQHGTAAPQGHEACTSADGTEAGEHRGSWHLGCPGQDGHATGLAFVADKTATWQQGKKAGGKREVLTTEQQVSGGPEACHGNDGNASDMCGGGIGDQPNLGDGDGGGHVRDDSVRGRQAGIGVQAAGEVHGQGEGMVARAQAIHLSGQRGERRAQWTLAAESDETV